jgi:hypothetical protein
MPQKDFILRLIEEAADALAQILGLRARNQPLEALHLVERTARRHIGLDLHQLDLLPYAALQELLSVGGRPDLPRFLLLAELRRLEGEIRDDLHGPGAGTRQSVVALRLFLDAAEGAGPAGLGEYRAQLDRVARRLRPAESSDPHLAALLARYDHLREMDAPGDGSA